MSWPVRIIIPTDNVLKIRWKRWLFSFIGLCAILAFAGSAASLLAPTEQHRISNYVWVFLLIGLGIYLACLAVRIYYYGMCLTSFDAYELESTIAKKEWAAWAGQKFYVAAYHLFTPPEISLTNIASSKSVEIYNEQQLKLRGHDGESYTEEQLFYELLSSVRVKIKDLSKKCIFDVIFTFNSNHTTFHTFKGCWRAIGFSEDSLMNYYYLNRNIEQVTECLLGIEENRICIVVSANVENVGYSPGLTEFASIMLITSQPTLLGNKNKGVALRALVSDKKSVEQEFLCMATYQPEVLQATKVFFSNMNDADILDVSDVLRSSALAKNNNWKCEAQNLNLTLGKLGGDHFWFIFSLSLFIAEKTKESVLMIVDVGNEYAFNVIKSLDNDRES